MAEMRLPFGSPEPIGDPNPQGPLGPADDELQRVQARIRAGRSPFEPPVGSGFIPNFTR